MSEKITNCPICKSDHQRPFEDLQAGSSMIHYRICTRCGAIFQSPRMDAGEIETFYQHGYRKLYQQTEEPTKKDLIMQQERAKITTAMIEADLASIERHLDIGSSSGELLLEMQKRYKCESVGVELGEAYRAFSLQRGLVVLPSMESLMEQNRQYDFISMMHVLEHLPDPVQTLRKLRTQLITPNGYLLVEVPNVFEHEALEVAHLFAFSPTTLKETIRRAGFRVVWTKTHGGFRSPILNLFITILAQPEEEPSRSTSFQSSVIGTLIRRRMGRLKRKFFTKLLPDWTWQAPETLWDIGREQEGE